MTAQELLIQKTLELNPDTAYITPDGKALYVLTDQRLVCIETEFDLTLFSDEEICKFLVDSLT